jgi:large subunit ribosomal protein L15
MKTIKPAIGSVKKKKRIGRGPGSGMGKTSTKGHKGQKARKGSSIRTGFEGGQTPLYRRLPKRGFKNFLFKNNYNEINLYLLNNFEDNTVINYEVLKEKGLINKNLKKIKILGNGELNKKLEVHANFLSENAKKKIESAGGKVIIIS